MDISAYLPGIVYEFFVSSSWLHFVFIAKIVSVCISTVFLVGIIILIIKNNYIGGKFNMYSDALARKTMTVPKKKLAKKWEEIKRMIESNYEADYKLALLEADKVFDEVLKMAGVRGADMGERLKSLNKSQLVNLDEIWWAHKLRNSMAHDLKFKLYHDDARKAIEEFEKAIEEFGALDF